MSETEVEINWIDNSDNETQFILERKVVGDEDFVELATLNNGVISFIDTDVAPENTYFYRVKAINDFAQSDYTEEISVTVLITGLEELGFSTNLFPNPVGAEKIVLLSLSTPIKSNLKSLFPLAELELLTQLTILLHRHQILKNKSEKGLKLPKR